MAQKGPEAQKEKGDVSEAKPVEVVVQPPKVSEDSEGFGVPPLMFEFDDLKELTKKVSEVSLGKGPNKDQPVASEAEPDYVPGAVVQAAGVESEAEAEPDTYEPAAVVQAAGVESEAEAEDMFENFKPEPDGIFKMDGFGFEPEGPAPGDFEITPVDPDSTENSGRAKNSGRATSERIAIPGAVPRPREVKITRSEGASFEDIHDLFTQIMNSHKPEGHFPSKPPSARRRRYMGPATAASAPVIYSNEHTTSGESGATVERRTDKPKFQS